MTATVFIIDDDQDVRDALQLLMESVGLSVESFASAQEYLDQFEPQRYGCLVLDIRMPGMSGLELQARLSAEQSHPPIIIMSGHGDIPMAVHAVQAGAAGFLEKPCNDQLLLDSVHRALEQDSRQRGAASRIAEIRGRYEQLTPRELEVMGQVVSGKRNKVIASDLGVSQSTVEVHRSRVMEKMGAKSMSDLMRMVIALEEC